jgi:DNA polymerase III alpha subunit
LFDWQSNDGQTDDWTLAERARVQEKILGLSVDVHPLELIKDQISLAGAISTNDVGEHIGKSIVVSGLRLSSHRARTTRGELMLFMSIEDLDGMLEVVFFPPVYQQYRQILRSNGPFLIRGIAESDSDEGDVWLRAERVKILNNVNP